MPTDAEFDRLRADRDEYARIALVGLSGLVPTPEKGYVRDGGPGLLAADLAAMRGEVARLKALAERLSRLMTLVGCERCGSGVRNRDMVCGLCPACARSELIGLRAAVVAALENVPMLADARPDLAEAAGWKGTSPYKTV